MHYAQPIAPNNSADVGKFEASRQIDHVATEFYLEDDKYSARLHLRTLEYLKREGDTTSPRPLPHISHH